MVAHVAYDASNVAVNVLLALLILEILSTTTKTTTTAYNPASATANYYTATSTCRTTAISYEKSSLRGSF